ncbi:MAG: energy transducer TonB [Bryobacteraceae bacterium]|jgi:hypothetical protein
MTQRRELRALGLAMISFAFVALANGEEKKTGGCDFGAYRPLKIGTPIRGGDEGLALEKASPVYPREALSKGIGGRVVVHVLINRAGDVVKACGVGPAPLATSAEEAVSKWRFRRDFGFRLAQPSSAAPQYAELRINFDFEPSTADQGQVSADISSGLALCAQTAGWAADQSGAPIWLNSEDLMRRVVQKAALTFPMLDHGRLRGEVKLNLRIDDQGRVGCAEAISGHPIAIAAAMTAIRDWRFKPYVLGGKTVSVLGHLTIVYDSAR